VQRQPRLDALGTLHHVMGREFLRRRGEKTASDERILGSGEFIERVLSEAEESFKEALKWRRRVLDLPGLLEKISKKETVEEQKIREGDRRRPVVGARKVFCKVAVKKLGYSGASVARFLGVTASLVNRYASSDEVGSLDQYL
jgi:putative transposase